MASELGDVAAHVCRAIAGPAGEEDFVTQDDGAGGTGAGDSGTPQHVFFGAPFERHFGVGCGGITLWAEESGPVGGVGVHRKNSEQREEQSLHGEVEPG